MVSSLWKDVGHLVVEPWQHVPYWRQQHPTLPWSNDFGHGLHPHEVLSNVPREMRDIDRQSREVENKLSGEPIELALTTSKPGFQALVDVHQFRPKEISVRVNANAVMVECMHEEREDEHGYISLQFQRRYSFPTDYDSNTITTELSSDGILSIRAPMKALEGTERVISIHHTGGPAHLTVKENKPIAHIEEDVK